MPKFKIVTFQPIHSVYEVKANSADEARKKFEDNEEIGFLYDEDGEEEIKEIYEVTER